MLIVDDEEKIRDLYFKILTKKCKLTKAKDGYEALEMAKKTHYDIAFIDVVMPKMNGLETF